MLSTLIIIAAAMGQTSQPAEEPARPARPISVATVAEADSVAADSFATTRPAGARQATVATPEEDASTRTTGVAGVNQSLAVVSDLGELTGDPIEVHATTTDIIIQGSEHDIAILQKLIELMDAQPPEYEMEFRVVSLDNAQATDVAPSVQAFWNEYKKPVTGQVRPEDRLTIMHDARANILMVATAKKNMDEVERLILQHDVPAFGPRREVAFTPIQLHHIRAAEAEAMIRDMLETMQQIRNVTKPLFTIKVDARTNRLLVSAPEDDLKQIRDWIELIDVEPDAETGGVVKVAFVPLIKADAGALASALSDMLATEADAASAMEEQVRMFQMILTHRGDEELPPVNLDKPIKIYAEPGTNSLVIATVESNLKPLLEVVKLLDDAPLTDDMLIQIYPLKHADAESLRDDLQSVFEKGTALARQPVSDNVKGRTPPGMTEGLVYEIGLVADRRTNSLIVTGRPEQFLMIDRIIKEVDVEEHANRFPLRMITLDHSDVRRVREAAQQLADLRLEMAERLGPMATEREKVLLIEDVWTNSLIVVAKDENFHEIEELARKLDDQGDEWLGEIRIINLPENLTAADLSDKIETLWERRAEIRREGGLPEDKPVIVTDSRSNALIIASNQEDYEAISRLVEQLEQQPINPMLDIYQIPVKNNDVSKMAEIIQRLFEERLKNSRTGNEQELPSERVFVMDDPMTGTLLMVSSKQNYQEVLELVKRLDVIPPVEGMIETFYVRNIDVTKAEEIVNALFDKGLYRPGGQSELPESLTRVTVVPDVRSSALIVSASPENLRVVKQILDEIDRVETPITQTEARFFAMGGADAVNIADILTQLLEGMRDTLPDPDQLQFTLIPETTRNNRLIVVGTRFAMQRAEELVPMLIEAPQAPTSTVKVYELKESSAAQMEQVLTRLFEERAPEAQTGARTPISIIPVDASNQLVVTASREDHEMVNHLLGMLDKPTELARQMDIIPLKMAKAERVSSTLSDLLDRQAREFEGGYAITEEPRTNSLVVWANPDMLKNIREIVEKLDKAGPVNEMALRVFKLRNSKADETAERLNDFFEKAGAGTGQDARAMIIKFFADVDPVTAAPIVDSKTGQAMMQSLIHQDVTITADENTNSLLVMAPVDNIDMMEMLIKMLDNVERETVSVKVFQLYNADATEMKTLLDELFQAGGGAQDDVRRIAIGGEGGVPAAGPGGAALELAFSVDERTNTLIAAGSPSYLRMVESLVYRLDYQEIDERIVRVVRLNNQSASDVATTLTEYFDEERGLLEEAAGGREAATRQLQRRVTVTEAGQGEDRESNVLLVSYSPRMESQVLRMIQELDQPVPQVMIQMLMAEVTLTDNFEMGMEFATQDLLFSEQAVIHPNTGLPTGPDFDFVFGSDVGAVGSSGLGGISFTMSGEDFDFLFRALQSEGRLEILSRPSIMVKDGQEATITIGENVPTVQDVVVGVGGTVTPSVNYQDVGIKLRVLPVINPDGYVSMEIEPEISAIAQSSVSIGAGVNLPIFTTRNALTSVMVKNGETIIIGGLITSRENDSENKVPLAGDLPILGNLFRSTSKTSTRTELLFVLTPHVVRVSEDARDISLQMRDETGLNRNVRTSPLMQGLQVKPDAVEFGPPIQLDKDASPGRVGPRPDQRIPGGNEEMGPAMEEYGPAADLIRTSGMRQAALTRE